MEKVSEAYCNTVHHLNFGTPMKRRTEDDFEDVEALCICQPALMIARLSTYQEMPKGALRA